MASLSPTINYEIKCICLQVTKSSVILLNGSKEIQHLDVNANSPIIQASSSDPYILVLTEDGQMVLITLSCGRNNTPQLKSLNINLNKKSSKNVHVCLYKDNSGLFTTERVSLWQKNL